MDLRGHAGGAVPATTWRGLGSRGSALWPLARRHAAVGPGRERHPAASGSAPARCPREIGRGPLGTSSPTL